MDLSLSGLASGFDWKTVVNQLVDVERTPEKRLSADQNAIQQRNNAYGAIKTQLTVLQARVDTLADSSLYESRGTQVDDSAVASATVGVGAPLGRFTFDFQQLASAARQVGTNDIRKPLSATDDV